MSSGEKQCDSCSKWIGKSNFVRRKQSHQFQYTECAASSTTSANWHIILLPNTPQILQLQTFNVLFAIFVLELSTDSVITNALPMVIVVELHPTTLTCILSKILNQNFFMNHAVKRFRVDSKIHFQKKKFDHFTSDKTVWFSTLKIQPKSPLNQTLQSKSIYPGDSFSMCLLKHNNVDIFTRLTTILFSRFSKYRRIKIWQIEKQKRAERPSLAMCMSS